MGATLGENDRQPLSKTLGQLWGLLFLTALFAMGGYRLTLKGVELFKPELAYFLWYGVLLVLGAGKGEFLFRRQFIHRTLARGRALGETGRAGDYLLAPFCMLSLYRPWQRKHQIVSWVLIPAMVTLAILFLTVVPDGSFKGAVDFGIGLALAYGALIYLMYLGRFLAWWFTGTTTQTNPLPELKPQPGALATGAPTPVASAPG